MSNKELYRELCQTQGDNIPLFQQYWWMEAVCFGKRWEVALAYDEQGQIIGAMPFLLGQKLGMRYVLQPQLTQYNGPWFNYPQDCSEMERLDFEKKVSDQLISQVQSYGVSYFYQHFSPAVTNWLPFYWSGFQQTTRYTYRLSDLSDLNAVFEGFNKKKRQKQILRHDGRYQTTHSMTPAQFADFHAEYWRGKGKKDLLSKSFIERVCQDAISRGQGAILALTEQESSDIIYARFIVWDSNCTYSLMSAHGRNETDNGINELLVWRAIQEAATHSKAFDFEGSMDPGIEYFYRLFGSNQTPYFAVSKCYNPLFKLLLKLKR